MQLRNCIAGLLALTACSPTETQNPISEAGSDQIVARDATVSLDGSASMDADGEVTTWVWTLLSAPIYSRAELSVDEENPALADFVADRDGVYTVSLQVMDNDGLKSIPDVIRITAQRPNERPIANISISGSAGVGETLVFDGTASTDPEESPLSYGFELVLAPKDSVSTLQESGGAFASLQPDVEGFYVVGLTVNDGLSDSIRTDVFIDLLNNSNEPPISVCGPPIIVDVGSPGVLDGSASLDPEGESLTYSWRLSAKPFGSAASIDNADQVLAQLNTDITGTYRGELTVNDGLFDSEPCEQEVVAEDAVVNQAPIADAGGIQSGKPGDVIVLDGSGSYDPDGDPLTITWALAALPAASTLTNADIANSNALNPTIVPDVEGRYTLRLNISDGALSSSDTADILIADNDAPVANAGADTTLALNDTATLDGSASSDPDGDPLSFLWSFLSVPNGSAITDVDISDPFSDTPSFTPDIAGQYSIRLSVTDGFSSSNDVVVVTANGSSSNNAPNADAGTDQQVSLGDVVQLDGSNSSDPDGDPLVYAWSFVTIPAGSALTDTNITGVFSDTASFTPDVAGIYVLGLGVFDGTDYGTDTVIIQVGSTTGNNAPIADAGADQTAQLGASITLDASGSSDADGDPLSYLWVFDQLPSGSTLTDIDIAQSGGAGARFTPDVAGVYTLLVGVSDGSDYDTDTVDITISTSSGNTAPTADAGVDQTLNLGDTANLDASASSDADGDPLTYAWVFDTKPSGSTLIDADISQSGIATASFTPDVAGVFTLRVAVSDGSDSDSDTLNITVNTTSTNTKPIADAGSNQTLTLGDTVNLDGSASSDADGDPLTYLWTLSSLPSSSQLNNADIANSSDVTASFVPDVQGVYSVRLRVGDGTEYATDALSLVVVGTNSPPTADAGANQSVNLGDTVNLDGTATTDPDGDPLTYQWLFASIPSTSTLTDADISSSTSTTPSFTPDAAGPYTIRLRVTDGIYPANDYVGVVVVGTNTAPTADAGGDLSASTGTLVTLDGSGSSDPEGDSLDFAWSLVAPAGSSAVLSDSTAERPSFIADVNGSYVAYLVVDDGSLYSSDVATVTASSTSANNRPSANAGVNQAQTLGSNIALDGSASSDPDGDPLSYQWTFARLPSTSALTDADINSSTSASANFTADVEGVYRIRLEVDDGQYSATDTTRVTVYASSSANAPPVADAGDALIVTLAANAQPDGSASFDPDGDPLVYDWSFSSLPTGSALTDADIQDYDTDSPTFTPDVSGIYILVLVVDDGLDTGFDNVVIRVLSGNTAPVADAGQSQSVSTGDTVSIDASNSSDADGDTLTYTWILTAPNGSTTSLASSTSASTTFRADISGEYELLLVVSDGQESDFDFLTVVAQ